MIKSKEVRIKANTRNIKRLRECKNKDLKIGDYLDIPISFLTSGSHQKVSCICDVCGKETQIMYQKYIKNISNAGYYSCSSKCSQDKVKKTSKENWGVEHYSKTNEYESRVKKTNLDKYDNEYYLSSKKGKQVIKQSVLTKYGVDNVFSNKKIIDKIKKTNIKKYGVDNPSKSNIVKDKIGKKSKENWIKQYKNHYKDKYDLDVISLDNSIYDIVCESCNKTFSINKFLLSNRLQLNMDICTLCNPLLSSKSSYESKVLNFLESIYDGQILTNTRGIIKPLELDFYIPDLKIAIEFNGLYWHNEMHKPKDYHFNKHKMCKDLGIELFQIWEDDWLYKNDIIKSVIKNKLGKNVENKIFGRKCKVEYVPSKIANRFLEDNHLKGSSKSKTNIGLYYNNDLVSLMSFGRNRVFMNKNSMDVYELHRFCNKINHSVIGGASKLLKFFKNNFDFKELISYYDKSFGFKSFYESIGFEFIKETSINYHYIKRGIRLHRYNFNKAKLVKLGYDPNMTENEITKSMGIYKIYGVGNYKYSISK